MDRRDFLKGVGLLSLFPTLALSRTNTELPTEIDGYKLGRKYYMGVEMNDFQNLMSDYTFNHRRLCINTGRQTGKSTFAKIHAVEKVRLVPNTEVVYVSMSTHSRKRDYELLMSMMYHGGTRTVDGERGFTAQPSSKLICYLDLSNCIPNRVIKLHNGSKITFVNHPGDLVGVNVPDITIFDEPRSYDMFTDFKHMMIDELRGESMGILMVGTIAPNLYEFRTTLAEYNIEIKSIVRPYEEWRELYPDREKWEYNREEWNV